jgi:hypothetical protein
MRRQPSTFEADGIIANNKWWRENVFANQYLANGVKSP